MKPLAMVWEWNWPHRFKHWQQITVIAFDFNILRTGDHSPGIQCCLVVFNFCILDFGYYNRHHADCGDGCAL